MDGTEFRAMKVGVCGGVVKIVRVEADKCSRD